ncbi:leucyl/phenylalanyl-tRNA--protein transferase [Methylomonas sp. EFPC3]|uniref:leucyl/phenylalanyl-tRNA--protein transferase n=1 Tax=Methylomonas sp. EFPC3 TaxID=3021710 RepID=UPI002416FFEC|nr:leucyl/phenylalanyl-tRNA--protein transferase [Methylomonas sp. EFPC3]WFP50526.1 leucyl/phenylalanyl-tRNA--protein transferase [Methylomonas sp. EFPC3]
MQLTLLDSDQPEQAFPPLDKALKEPNGLLAFGGCLSPKRIVNAYRHGAFPWFNPGEPILWWSPDPRLVLFPEHLQVSRSLTKTLRKGRFEIRYDTAFKEVIAACAAPRSDSGGTWITEDMCRAYLTLHHLGIAHSCEAWLDGKLAGGLYGLAIGQVFFGESMFHRETDASKVAFVNLVERLSGWGYRLIDCQVRSEHLLSLGAEEIPRQRFAELLEQLCRQAPAAEAWR